MEELHPFYSPDTYRPENSTGYLVNKLAQAVTREIDRRMVDLGLTDAQWKPLVLLRQGNCVTAADLSRLACHDTGAVTRLLDRLEAKHLIRRVRSETDRRVVNLELTDEGEKVSAEVPKILSTLANQVLAGFSEDEFHVFRDLLGRALSNVQALSGERNPS
jgi:DNA-binding MarR family transcriptional regulator